MITPGDNLEGEQEEESHHQAEQSHGLGQSESQDSVGEKLLLQGGVPGITNDKRSKDRSNTSSGSSDSNSCGSGSNELGGGVNVPVGGAGLQAPDGGGTRLGHSDHGGSGGDDTGNGRHPGIGALGLL